MRTGNTQFSFNAANLSFSATNYEWLVVAGAKAQFKETGTINGAGNYGFMLTAIDGGLNGGGGADEGCASDSVRPFRSRHDLTDDRENNKATAYVAAVTSEDLAANVYGQRLRLTGCGNNRLRLPRALVTGRSHHNTSQQH